MSRKRVKTYRIPREAWRRHDRRVELGLLEVAARVQSLYGSELDGVVAEVEERGAMSALSTMAVEAEREEQRTADALTDENPSEAAAARTRARAWREVSRLISLVPLGVDLTFVRGEAPPEVVLDALAEYLVGVWLDRRQPKDDQKELA